jgi:hypothetical protein
VKKGHLGTYDRRELTREDTSVVAIAVHALVMGWAVIYAGNGEFIITTTFYDEHDVVGKGRSLAVALISFLKAAAFYEHTNGDITTEKLDTEAARDRIHDFCNRMAKAFELAAGEYGQM